jgi:hypothetical protein
MSPLKDKPKGLVNEISPKKPVNSLGFSEMEQRYASHILQAMEFLKDVK